MTIVHWDSLEQIETSSNCLISIRYGYNYCLPFRNPLYHSWISDSVNSVLFLRSSSSSGFNLLFCFPMISVRNRFLLCSLIFYSMNPLLLENSMILKVVWMKLNFIDHLIYFIWSWTFNVSDKSYALALSKIYWIFSFIDSYNHS